MKLILTSPDIILNANPSMKDTIISNLKTFPKEQFEIVFISSDQSKLEVLSKDFKTLQVSHAIKQGASLINFLVQKGFKHEDMIVIAANNGDCIMAFNHKLLLFSARWITQNKQNNMVFEYGIGLKTEQAINLIATQFLTMQHNPWFYSLQVDEKTSLYSLINANTINIASSDENQLINLFKSNLKEGDTTHRQHLIAYFLVSTHYALNLRDVNYFGVYPSSSTNSSPDLEAFRDRLRKQYKIKFNEDFFIRQTPTAKRHHQKNKDLRIRSGCDSQFDTIIINPKLRNKLRNKTVCIIDDYTTYGTSCETVRHLLTSAGVEKIIFISLGKFGKEYHKYNYQLSGDVFDSFTYSKVGSSDPLSGNFNTNANVEMLNSLNHLVS